MKTSKIVSSIAFKFAETFVVKGLGLIISIILARFLAPEEFGQIAIIMVFINLSHAFVQSGLGTALIQNKTATKEDYSTVFYISLVVAIVLVTILWFTAPLIGVFYENSAVVLPLRVYSFSLIMYAFNMVQGSKLSREMAFNKHFVCSLVSRVLSGVLGCVMAYAGFGIWALIAYYFSSSIFSCIAMLWVARWWPSLTFSVSRAKELFSFGWKMMVSSFLCSLYADIRTLIIGKRFSESDLGYYSRGQQFPDIIAGTMEGAILTVMFTVMSRSQENLEEVKRTLHNTMARCSLLVMPAMIGLAVVAEPFIRVVLTDKWLPTVPFMQIICLANLTMCIVSAQLMAVKSIGRSDVYMGLEIVRRAAMLLVLIVSVVGFGTVEAIAWGYVFSSWLDVLIIAIPCKKLLNYPVWQQIASFGKVLLVSVLMGVVVGVVSLLPLAPLAMLALQVVVGAASYIAIGMLLRLKPMLEMWDKAKKLCKR